LILHNTLRGDRDCMVIGFITTLAISANYHESCEFEPLHDGIIIKYIHFFVPMMKILSKIK
jgi:hypothetical protein